MRTHLISLGRLVAIACLAVGTAMLGQAVWTEWGTGIEAAHAQSEVREQVDEELATTTTAGESPTVTGASAAPQQGGSVAKTGSGIGTIDIPAIGLSQAFVEGTNAAALRKGPGHYVGTAMPGQRGNVGIAGHRTTYGAPFNRIDELEPGDEIILTTTTGRWVYMVTGTQVVAPSQNEVLADQGDSRLTLTSCHPKRSDRQRIVVTATLRV